MGSFRLGSRQALLLMAFSLAFIVLFFRPNAAGTNIMHRLKSTVINGSSKQTNGILSNNVPRVVIIGAGPTGLGAATRLNQLGHANWDLYEKSDIAGGLARSFVDENNFTWDIGGHVIFSHYKYFDDVLDVVVKDWNHMVREAWVWSHDTFIPYPFQNNIHRLPVDVQLKCIKGLLKAKDKNSPEAGWKSFGQWIDGLFGEGLAEVFMRPYNFKVWAYSPDNMTANWMGERVPTINLNRILDNVLKKTDDVAWGPNAKFRYPKLGGTGSIWKSIASRLPEKRLHFNKVVNRVDLGRKQLSFKDGSQVKYDWLISTAPLNHFLAMVKDVGSNFDNLRNEAATPWYSSTHVIGLGFNGELPKALHGKCWMYFPESNCPFYRATVFSHYSPNNVAKPLQQWSLMFEVSESPQKPVSDDIVQATIDGAIASKLITNAHLSRLVTRFHIKMEQGYPTPFLERDKWLGRIQPVLEANNVLSRGRFGGWRYEVGNQDHSLMQGVEAVDRALFGAEEQTYFYPDHVNSRKNTTRHWSEF